MTTTVKSTHRTLASLKLPTKVASLTTYAQQIVTAMTGNAAFASPVPTLGSLEVKNVSAVTSAVEP